MHGSEPCRGRVWDQQDCELSLLGTCKIILLTAVAGKVEVLRSTCCDLLPVLEHGAWREHQALPV